MLKKLLCVLLAGLLALSFAGCITINTTAPVQTAAPTAAVTVPATDAAAVTATEAATLPPEALTYAQPGWETAPADKLYRPSGAYFIDQYPAYVFCIDTAVQDYVKMRFGPSKSHFNTVGVQINNYGTVTVETQSVNGWRLCCYNGMEGWIRSDFIFNSVADIDRYLGVGQASGSVETVPYHGLYVVYVDDQYAGEPLNMRSGPGRSYDLIKQLPDDTLFMIGEGMPIIDGWVYGDEVVWSDDGTFTPVSSGYVLFKYLHP
ncbi:MAG: hypothetical protein IJK40_01195, partial [Clostridia bacterium]|nr:hypothetical protein [Clostridia bacterium]